MADTQGINNRFLQKMLGVFGTRQAGTSIQPDSPLLGGGLNGKRNHGQQRLKLPGSTPLSLLWSWFLTEQYDSYETLRWRKNRYTDIDFAIKNSPILQMAADLYADEAVQCETSGTPVRVNAKSEVQSYLQDLLAEWGIDQQTVRECIWNKVVFGDSFDTNDIDPKEGIRRVTPVSVWDISDRVEFNPSKALEKLRYYSGMEGQTVAAKLSVLTANLEDSASSPSQYFNKYLFGFELQGGQMVPPWSVTHYRAFSMLREFEPWGRSRFINVLPMFRQLMSAEGLMQVARAASFPRDLYQVASEPGATVTEKWEALEEFQEQLDNAGLYEGAKEVASIGSRIIVPKDLVEYSQLISNIDLDAIADVEYLRDNEIMATAIPKGYLIVDKGGQWGTSGQSLLQQSKPFGRKVFSDQSDYLAGLTEKIKIHLSIVNKFQGWSTPFELLMDFPVMEESSERLGHKAEELTLANSVLSTLQTILGVDSVPPDIVKDAFGMMTSFSQDKIDFYVDKLVKANANAGGYTDSEEGFEGAAGGDNPIRDFKKAGSDFGERKNSKHLTKEQMYERAVNRWQESRTKDNLCEEIIRTKASFHFVEGSGAGKHYRNSLIDSRETAKNRMIFESFINNELTDEEKKVALKESYFEKDNKEREAFRQEKNS